jgi:PAS domain S-box-containing protein
MGFGSFGRCLCGTFSDAPEAEGSSGKSGMNEKQPVNILMVDDQLAKLLSYEAILKDLDENLVRASSGTEALEYLLKSDVAVLLMDVSMPGLDGFELATLIRQHPRFRNTAILFISAVHLTDIDRLRGYQLGAVDYIPVPVVPQILRAKVKVFVDLFRKTRQLEEMNTELERRIAERTAELSASEERFRLATEAMRGGLYDWDLDSRVWWKSDSLKKMAGYLQEEEEEEEEEEEPLLEKWLSRVHPDDLEGARKRVQSALENGTIAAFEVEYRIRHKSEQWKWVWDRGRIVRDPQGRAVRVVGYITDISGQKKAEEALKEVDQRKNEFLATLSHELRNPLAPIRNAVNILKMDGVPPAHAEKSRDVIDRQLAHLTRLVDDLLDLSRISRNSLNLKIGPMSLAEAVNSAVEAVQPFFEELEHQVSLSLPREPILVEGDLVRLAQVFSNLLNNSAKFTPTGGRIRLTVEPEGDQTVVRIKDTGRGIDSKI